MKRLIPKKKGKKKDSEFNPTTEKPSNVDSWLSNFDDGDRKFIAIMSMSGDMEQFGMEQNWDGRWFFTNRLRGGSSFSRNNNIEFIQKHNFETMDSSSYSIAVGFRLVLHKGKK